MNYRKIMGTGLAGILLTVTLTADQIHEAVKAGDLQQVRSLLAGDSKLARIPDENGMTPLHWVSISGRQDLAELLIDAGADLNAADKWNLTPLSRANQLGHLEVVNLLLERGVRLPTDLTDIQRFSHYAAANGHIKLFELLTEKTADAGRKNLEGGTYLHSAAEGGAIEIADLLLKQGTAVSMKDRYGWTALHVAAWSGHKSMVERLLKAGADLDIRTIEGKTALHYAEERGKKDVAELLKSKGADLSLPSFPDLRGEYLGLKMPGEKPEIFALGIVSTRERCHSSLAVSPDGKAIYWSPGWRRMLCMQQKNDRWLPPRIPDFYLEMGDTEPVFSHDGKRLYFLSQRPVDQSEEEGKSSKENIWYVERAGGGWSQAKPLSPVVNAMALHWQISLAENENLYFGSDEPGGKGGSDIYVSKRINGAYSQPVNLGDAVNTGFNDFSPFIAPDESYLLFTRQGPVGSRRADLFVSFRRGDGSWTEAVSLGPDINSGQGDYCPMVSPDGKYLFFVSIRNGNQDLYWVDAAVIEKLRK